MNRFLRLGTLTLAMTTTMFAGQITQNFTFGPSNTDVDLAQTTQTANFFQSAAGWVAGSILNSVTLDIMITETITALSITNNSGSSQTFTYNSTATYQAAGSLPDLTLFNQFAFDDARLNHGVTTYTPTVFSLFTSGAQTLPGGGSLSPTVPVVTTTDSTLYTSGNAAAYDTTGTFTLGYITATSTGFTGGGGVLTAGQNTTTNATFALTYNFTEPSGVPEPGTMTLLGSALLGLGFVARKRLQK